MTDAEIIAMFKPGTKWRVRTTDGTVDEIHTVTRMNSTRLSMRDKNGSTASRQSPTGACVKEARPGYVRVNYSSGPIDAIFTLQDTQHTLFYGAP